MKNKQNKSLNNIIDSLKESKSMWRSLMENSTNYILIVDPEGIIRFISHTAHGFSIRNVVGNNIYNFLAPEYHNTAKKTIKQVIKTGKPGNYESKATIPRIGTFWYETLVVPIKHNRNTIAVSLISTDITDRKKAKETLKKSEEKFRTFMETASDLVHITDKDGNLTYVNKSMAETLGYSKKEMVGIHITQLLDKKSMKDFKPGLKKLIAKGEATVEPVFVTKDRKKIYGEVKIIAIYDNDGNFTEARAIFRDITKHKKMEEELRLKNKEIEKWNKELKKKVDEGIKRIQEAEKMALVGKLSAGIVHEINNPLYGISNYLELLSDEKEKKLQKKYLNMVSHGVNIIKSITDTLLDMSQISRLNLEQVNINKLIKDVLDFSMPDTKKSGIKVSTKFQKNIPDLPLDKNKIKQVFLNLITNAVESMSSGGKLKISSKLTDHKLCISFTDTGIGISRENLPRIFEPFFSDKRKHVKRGVGLGLFMSSNIASIHKGEIEVKSTAGKGSTFNVILPVT